MLCPICNTPITFWNKLGSDAGLTTKGEKICNKCYFKLHEEGKSGVITENDIIKIKQKKQEEEQKLESLKVKINRVAGFNEIGLSIDSKISNFLLDYITDDEIIIGIVTGTFDDSTVHKSCLIATDKKFLIVRKPAFYNLLLDMTLNWNEILSCDCKKGLVFADLSLKIKTRNIKFKQIIKGKAEVFCIAVKQKLEDAEKATVPVFSEKTQIDIIQNVPEKEKNKDSVNISNITDELLKLAKLRENGFLSQEEFEILKNKLINS